MRTRVGLLLAIVAAGIALSKPAAQQADVPDTAVITTAGRYVASYQQSLTSIVADEAYNQDIVERTPPDPDAPRSRKLRSEIFFMFAPVRHDWMTIRDVQTVDGKAVKDRPDPREALSRLPAQEVARTFKQHNARYNIGQTFRNFNEPTMSLLVFDAFHSGRFAFERRRVERAGDVTLVTLAFVERDKPTLIVDPSGEPVFVKGEATLEAGSGRVRHIQIAATAGAVRFTLTTTYTPDRRLDMWVPSRFREDYELGIAPKAWSPASYSPHERIHGEAVYTNFRRFDTSVRIK